MAIIDIEHKGLRELFENERTRKIGKDLHNRSILIMDYLDQIQDLSECSGVRNFHALTGDRKGQFAMSVSGNFRIVFTYDDGDVTIEDFTDYH